MRYLVDTHIAIWALIGDRRLSGSAKRILADPSNRLFVSDISAWEVAVKRVAKPRTFSLTPALFMEGIEQAGFHRLELNDGHIIEYARLPLVDGHRDPFDRMLLAQAKAEGMVFMTHDVRFEAYRDPDILIV